MAKKRLVRQVASLGVLGVGALLGSLWFERRTELTLPAPTGPFAVGRSLYDWVDDTTPDTLAPEPATKRELLVWIWYPAAPEQSGAVVDDYVPASVRPPAGRAGGALIFRLLTRDLSKVHGHSFRNADMSPLERSNPVVIMRAGASLEVATYSTLAEDLASHGYVVVGFDAPYRTRVVVFPDGRVIARRPENNPELFSGDELTSVANKLLAAWTGDIAFVLVFGHSFGGATAAKFCSQDSRCKAGIDVDGSLHDTVIQAGIHEPFMFLLSGNGDFSSDSEIRQIMADIQSVYDRLPANARSRIVIRGANHFTFSDDGALLKSRLLRGVLRVFGKLGIDGRRQLAVTASCVHSFFDAYLKEPGVWRLAIFSPAYPEIQILN